MSPTIFKKNGLRFYFFSREETRLHVHVQGERGKRNSGWNRRLPSRRTMVSVSDRSRRPADSLRNIKMKSATRGAPTLAAEVTNVSGTGFWLLMDHEELFVAFSKFPWFRDASIGALVNVRRPAAHHLYWPDLDVDPAVESLTHPEHYPLVSRQRPGKDAQKTPAAASRTTRSTARSTRR